jgi:hypothetical protein
VYRLVWPQNLSWNWGPKGDQAAEAGQAARNKEQQRRRQLPAPLGVLLVEVVAADLEPRYGCCRVLRAQFCSIASATATVKAHTKQSLVFTELSLCAAWLLISLNSAVRLSPPLGHCHPHPALH